MNLKELPKPFLSAQKSFAEKGHPMLLGVSPCGIVFSS
jgi:hypothetical protein